MPTILTPTRSSVRSRGTHLIYTETPNRGGMLRAVVVPQVGGDTGWVDTAGAYKALPSVIKAKLQGLHIVHSYAKTHSSQSMIAGNSNLFPDVVQPLVYVHPENDLPVLNIGPSTAKEIVGLNAEEGTELLAFLIDFATREERAYIHTWKAGDLVIWDNWRTMHRAYGHPKRYPRVVRRTTLKDSLRLGRWLEHGRTATQQPAA